MIPFTVCIEEKKSYSIVIFAKSEEDCREKAERLDTSSLKPDDQKLTTTFFRTVDDEE